MNESELAAAAAEISDPVLEIDEGQLAVWKEALEVELEARSIGYAPGAIWLEAAGLE